MYVQQDISQILRMQVNQSDIKVHNCVLNPPIEHILRYSISQNPLSSSKIRLEITVFLVEFCSSQIIAFALEMQVSSRLMAMSRYLNIYCFPFEHQLSFYYDCFSSV